MVYSRSHKQWISRLGALVVGAYLAFITTRPEANISQEAAVDRDDGEKGVNHNRLFRRELEIDKLLNKVKDPAADDLKKRESAAAKSPQDTLSAASPNSSHSGILTPHPFIYTIEPRGVCDDDPLYVIFVHSAPTLYKRRKLLRQTWANNTFHEFRVPVVFVVATHREHAVREAVAVESDLYRDILSEDLIDDYKNLTHKAVGALRWILANCKNTKFIVKTDDDAFVNVFSLQRHLADLWRTGQTGGLFMCRYQEGMPVLRRGKWNVTREEYPEEHYPPYCSGIAYILSRDVAQALYEASFHTKLVWVDDAWMTGMVARTANIKHTRINSAYSLIKSAVEEKFLGETWYQFLFAHLGPLGLRDVWKGLTKLAAEHGIPKSNRTVVPGLVVNSGRKTKH